MSNTDRQTRVMFLGTCRMHDPMKVLTQAPDLMARSTPHRLHTPRQTLQFVQHFSGAPQFLPTTVHLVSDHATTELFVNGTSRAELMNRMTWISNLWKSFDVFVIEICTLREFIATLGRRDLVVNTFAKRDQERYAEQITAEAAEGLSVPLLDIRIEHLKAPETHREMRRIKAALGGRPVIWVSHQRPPDLPQYQTVNDIRRAGAQIVRRGAEAMGDVFYDPTEVAREMGAEAFFQKDGTDIDHMTPAAAEVMAQRYHAMILRAAQKARVGA